MDPAVTYFKALRLWGYEGRLAVAQGLQSNVTKKPSLHRTTVSLKVAKLPS